MITHGEGGEAQHPVPAEREVVVAVHVCPPGGSVHVPEPVDLDHHTCLLPACVQPAHPATLVLAQSHFRTRFAAPVSGVFEPVPRSSVQAAPRSFGSVML